MGARRGTGHRGVAVPIAGWATACVHRCAQGHASAGHDHRRSAGVRAITLVGASAPQSDRVAIESGAAVPSGRGGHQRSLPHGCQARDMTIGPPRSIGAQLAAAAKLARDGRLVVRVVTGYSAVDLRSYVEFAADQAGVDYAVAPSSTRLNSSHIPLSRIP